MEFAREPPVNPEAFDLNALVTERVSLLKPAHPSSHYRFKLDVRGPRVHAGTDLVGILTNLLENAADAAGTNGTILTITSLQGDQAVVEVHDSGPGISDEASHALFEPTITFKKHGGTWPVDRTKERARCCWGRYHAGERRAWRRRFPG